MSTQLYVQSKKRKPRRKVIALSQEELQSGQVPGFEPGTLIDSEHLLISSLLPPAVNEFLARLDAEVRTLCGKLHERAEGMMNRWGVQRGSIYLGGQKVAIEKPRVRGPNGEQVLQTYARFQDPAFFDQQVFQEGIRHVSQRDYEKALPKIAASFGLSKRAVSKSWVKAHKSSWIYS